MPRAFSWLQRYLEILDVSPEQLHTRVCKPLVMVTACSGSGAPSVVLEMLVGGHNIVELAASDRSGPVRAFLKETQPSIVHLFHDIAGTRVGGWCDMHSCGCPPLPAADLPAYDKEDLFVAGFVCKAFSSYSNERFTHESVAQMFESDSHLADRVRPFEECARHIRRRRPRIAVLENVSGCLKKMRGQTPGTSYEAPIDFLMRGIKQDGDSRDFDLPHVRPRLYFILAETNDLDGDPTGNDEGTLDCICHIITTHLQSVAPCQDSADDFRRWAEACAAEKGVVFEQDPRSNRARNTRLSESRARDVARMKRRLHIGSMDDAEFSQHTNWARGRNTAWDRCVSHRQEVNMNLLFWELKKQGQPLDGVVFDYAKSVERGTYRVDGWSPALSTNSKLYHFGCGKILNGAHLMAMQGFPMEFILEHAAGKPSSFLTSLAGNAMSVPVLGAVMMAAVICTKWGFGRESFHCAKWAGNPLSSEAPDSQETLEMPGEHMSDGSNDDSEDGST